MTNETQKQDEYRKALLRDGFEVASRQLGVSLQEASTMLAKKLLNDYKGTLLKYGLRMQAAEQLEHIGKKQLANAFREHAGNLRENPQYPSMKGIIQTIYEAASGRPEEVFPAKIQEITNLNAQIDRLQSERQREIRDLEREVVQAEKWDYSSFEKLSQRRVRPNSFKISGKVNNMANYFPRPHEEPLEANAVESGRNISIDGETFSKRKAAIVEKYDPRIEALCKTRYDLEKPILTLAHELGNFMDSFEGRFGEFLKSTSKKRFIEVYRLYRTIAKRVAKQ